MINTRRISEKILWAEIDRPKARNAINFEVIDQLENLISDIEKDEELLVFIFSGAGDESFIAGGDLKEFHTITDKTEAAELSLRMQTLFERIEQLPCWNIAYVNGDAYGGGIELMMAFDFILSATHSKFGFTQGRFYLSPGWGGLTRLIERVGRSKALEWQAKATIKTAEEMLRESFLNAIREKKHVLEWITPLTKNGRSFIQTLKQSAYPESELRIRLLRNEIDPFSDLWVHEEHIRRVENFMNKSEKK